MRIVIAIVSLCLGLVSSMESDSEELQKRFMEDFKIVESRGSQEPSRGISRRVSQPNKIKLECKQESHGRLKMYTHDYLDTNWSKQYNCREGYELVCDYCKRTLISIMKDTEKIDYGCDACDVDICEDCVNRYA